MQDELLLQYLKMVCSGKKNMITGKALEMRLHISGNELRRRIHRLRCRGLPIAATRRGYFYAENAAELYATILQLKKLRDGTDKAISGLEAAMERFGEPGGRSG